MHQVGKPFARAVVFGASGGIGAALTEALAASGAEVWAGSRGAAPVAGAQAFRFEFDDEDSLAQIAARLRGDPPDLIIVATGVLTLPGGRGPERSLRQIDGEAMAEVFKINTIGPALVARHILPILPRERRSVFAVLGARVGSISDNRLGGWHSYRASKAALAMLVRNFAIEMARTHPKAVIAALHPGTVATPLSAPFQANVPEGQLHTPEAASAHLLSVIEGLTPEDSGAAFDWKGERIPA